MKRVILKRVILILLCVIAVIAVAIYINLNFTVPGWAFVLCAAALGALAAFFFKVPVRRPKKGDRHDF